jgi:FkbM family methyltransferase
MDYPRLPFFFRSYFVHEMPGWGKLYEALGLGGIDNRNPLWRNGPTLQTRGKLHGYLMELDLSDDTERMVYFLQKLPEAEIPLLIDVLLKPGDSFVDIGANIGMMTLHAARLVGPRGRVLSVEPQPSCCAKISRALTLNGIEHVQVHNVGLADSQKVLTLNVLGNGTVLSTFATDGGDNRNVTSKISVDVCAGDDLFRGQILGRLTIKMDVEGFELFALRGLSGTIEEHRPLIVCEVNPDFLRRAGADVDQLFDFFHDRGYRGYGLKLVRRRLRLSFGLSTINSPNELGHCRDALWIPGGEECFDPSPYLV